MIRDQGYRAREGIAKTTDGDLKNLSASFMDPIPSWRAWSPNPA